MTKQPNKNMIKNEHSYYLYRLLLLEYHLGDKRPYACIPFIRKQVTQLQNGIGHRFVVRDNHNMHIWNNGVEITTNVPQSDFMGAINWPESNLAFTDKTMMLLWLLRRMVNTPPKLELMDTFRKVYAVLDPEHVYQPIKRPSKPSKKG